MKKLLTNKKLMFVVVILFGLFFLSGCAKITDNSGQILPEKIISLSTSFNSIISTEGWFEAFFIWPLAQMINFVSPYGGVVFGIVLVTVVVNLLTFGVSVKSTVSSQKMQIIQPEITKVQEKYKDRKDQQSQMAMSQEVQNIYNKHNINPFGALLTPFLQMPIIIAMWQAVQRSSAVVTGEIFGSKLTMTPMEGFTSGHYIIVVIFILMIAAQALTTRLPQMLAKRRLKNSRKAYAQDAPSSQKSMGMVNNFMVVFIGFLGLNWPAAMSLYWLVSSAVGIAKTYYIQRRYIDNEEV